MKFVASPGPAQRTPLKVWLELCRVSNLPTVWTNALAAVVLCGEIFRLENLLILIVSMSCFYTGGMCLNDIWDTAFDGVHNPGRPLPSQRISMRGAWTLTVILFSTGFIVLRLAPYRAGMFAGLLLLTAVLIYDRYHKNQPWSVFVMGACRFLVFAVSSLAVAGRISPEVLIAGIAQFFYVLLLSVAARIESRLKRKRPFSSIPLMIAGISLLDGIVMAVLASFLWLLPGIMGAFLTFAGQRYVRGD